MESLEIGMQWTALQLPNELLSGNEQAGSPNRQPHHSLPGHLQAGPSNASGGTVISLSKLSDTLILADGDSVSKGEGIALELKPDDTAEAKGKASKSNKKRKLKAEKGDHLDRFGPPRQSIRARINLEYHAPPELPETLSTTTSQTARTGKNLPAFETVQPANIGKEKRSRRIGKISGNKGKFRGNVTRRELKKEVKGKRPNGNDIHPSMMLTEEDLNSDEIVAYQPGSLEAMSLGRIDSETKRQTLQQRLQGKKRRSRKAMRSKVAERTETPLVGIASLDDPGSIPVKLGIRSSTFRRVMRLVADLPPIEIRPRRPDRRVPDHRPLVWAMSRQELCEALPYYRAFQSGLYLHQGVAFGYLLDGFPAPRDACAHNARVIISHGGGHCIRPTLDDGQILPPVLSGDQLLTDFRVATLVRAWKRRVPLVLLAGSGYELLPFKLNCSYAVLGWYWVSMVWTEAEPVAQGIKRPAGRDWYKRVKVRFDWVESQGTPWWEQSAAPKLQPKSSFDAAVSSPQSSSYPVSNLVQATSTRQSTPATLTLQTDPRSSIDADTSLPPLDQGLGVAIDLLPMGRLTEIGSRRSDPLVYPSDLKTGLLTRPITPPTYSSYSLIPHQKACPGMTESLAISRSLKRRIPGDYLMAPSRAAVSVEAAMDPFIDMRRQCDHCCDSSPGVYSEGWMCLNTSCTAYWMLKSDIGLLPVPPGLELSYHASFLKPAATPRDVRQPYDVVPPRPKAGIPDEAGPGDSAGSRSLWRGWVCEDCGRANCRFRWEVWQCLGCHQLLAPINPYSAVVPAQALCDIGKAILGDAKIDTSSGISVTMRRIRDPAATVMIYTLPDKIGTIYHVINECNEFADDIFDRYQREAASTRVPLFQRRPLNAHQIRGQLLAQHFAVNSGVSYKYNVDSLSLSFDESPSCVIQALDAITLRTQRVVGTRVHFNEVLSVLYREGQKMSWHDDGEPGLGSIVAGLSLGSFAVISWRRKSAHCNINAAFNTGMPDPRKEATPPIALSLTTSHGDIVMMEGRDMQKKYVHRVIPNGFRVAATARVIGK